MDELQKQEIISQEQNIQTEQDINIPESPDVQPEGQGQQAQEELIDWTKDKRYSEMWKEDPNNLYKSYKQIEPEWQKTREAFKKYGLKDISELEGIYTKVNEYENPENPKNKLFGIIESVMQNDKYGKVLEDAFQNINQAMLQDRWGESTPPHVRQQLEELSKYKEMFEQQESQRQIEAKANQIQASMQTTVQEILSLSEQYGIDFSAEEFLTECMQKQVPPEYLKSYFLEKTFPEIIKAKEAKTAEQVQSNIQNNHRAGIQTGEKAQRPTAKPIGIRERVDGWAKKYNIS